MTPNEIEVLLHCHVCPAQHDRIDAPAVREAIEMFLSHSLIEKDSDEDFYRTTAKGSAMVNILCSAAPPVPAWVDERGNIVG